MLTTEPSATVEINFHIIILVEVWGEHAQALSPMHWQLIFLVQVWLREKEYVPKAWSNQVWTHDLSPAKIIQEDCNFVYRMSKHTRLKAYCVTNMKRLWVTQYSSLIQTTLHVHFLVIKYYTVLHFEPLLLFWSMEYKFQLLTTQVIWLC